MFSEAGSRATYQPVSRRARKLGKTKPKFKNLNSSNSSRVISRIRRMLKKAEKNFPNQNLKELILRDFPSLRTDHSERCTV